MKKKQLISLIIILIIITVTASYYFINLGPVSNSNEKVDVTISKGSSITKVASMLKEKSLIKNKTVFMLYYKIHNLKLQAGKYTFMPSESVKDIASKLNHGEVSNTVTWLKLIEGHTLKNYADKYSQVLSLNSEEVIKGLEDKAMLSEMINKYWFLTKDISKKGIYFPLEGYLFPDSYQVYYNSQIKDIVKKQLTNLEKKLEPFKTKIESEKLNVHEIITMASLIEKEANSKEDRYMVAGVIKNRIDKKMTLGLDVTTYYAEQVEMGSVKDLTIAQYNASNDYNTRGPLVGYPIGPICNPSLESIEAALFPKETDNLYFFAEKSGKVHFSKTLEEHNIIKNKYKW